MIIKDIPEFTCPKCKSRTDYNERYDSYFCKSCDLWNSTACKDPKCEFCTKRPEKPSMKSKK